MLQSPLKKTGKGPGIGVTRLGSPANALPLVSWEAEAGYCPTGGSLQNKGLEQNKSLGCFPTV